MSTTSNEHSRQRYTTDQVVSALMIVSIAVALNSCCRVCLWAANPTLAVAIVSNFPNSDRCLAVKLLQRKLCIIKTSCPSVHLCGAICEHRQVQFIGASFVAVATTRIELSWNKVFDKKKKERKNGKNKKSYSCCSLIPTCIYLSDGYGIHMGAQILLAALKNGM